MIDLDFLENCFSVNDYGTLIIESLYSKQFPGNHEEWNLLVSCVEDNINDSYNSIDYHGALKDFKQITCIRD